ncbi:NAD-dependent epimerase/dehydratase family protein [Methylomonas sp. AM2-LC]|uniref:NAD-dependent epimerase/dehydratase family protein n=1 Tax=Methylomonas sp. AM2-LC TaxID=3153301 RepID=UPI0032651601
MHKVLITGCNGFIGSQLAHTLQNLSRDFTTLTRQPCDFGSKNWVLDLAVDPCPTELCAGIDTIFHLAGKAHALAETRQDEHEYFQINTEATRKLLEAAQQAGVQHFVYFSSVKAVGDSLQQPMDESVNPPADTPYGRSKYAAEQLVLHGGYIPHPVVIRPSMVYGNSRKGNLPKMINAIQRGFFPPLPEFNNRRSMVHVNDVVSAALLASQKTQASGQIYIITDQQNYSSRQLYNWIRAALGKPSRHWAIPFEVLRLLAKTGDMISRVTARRFVFDSDALLKLSGSASYSSAKITSELGFSPRHTLSESLPDIIRYLNLI